MYDDVKIRIFEGAAEQYARMVEVVDRRAVDVSRASEQNVVLSGIPTRIRVFGAALAERFVRPFQHLAGAEGVPPDFRIDLWDESETGIACPGDAVMGHPLATEWGEVIGSPDGRYLVRVGTRSLEIYNRSEQRIVGWSVRPHDVSLHERGRPLLQLLLRWHRDRRLHMIHGGLIAERGVGVLLTGKGGSGKSTTALSCALDGMGFLSEDFLAIRKTGPARFTGYSVFGSAKLHTDHLRRFPRLRAVALDPERPEDEKSLVFLQDVAGVRLSPEVTLGAVVAPVVTDRVACQAVRIRPGEALRYLAPSTLIQLNGARSGEHWRTFVARNLDDYQELLAACPCYRLELGSDLTSLAPAIRQIVEDAGPPPAGEFSHGHSIHQLHCSRVE